VETLFHRRRELPELKSSNFNLRAFGERVALNMPIQGAAADVMKLAMIAVHRRLAAEGLQARLVLQVHDELIVECPESIAPQVAELVSRGHEIGNHSATHPHMAQQTAAQIREELRKTSDLVKSITGKPTTLFRPPYGEYNDMVVRVSREEGYECVQWNVDSLDWKNISAEDMVARCTKKLSPGDIVLFHNDSKYILEALPVILEYYQQAGYNIIPVSQILLQGETWIDHAGTQHLSTPSPKPQATPAAI